MMVASFPLRPVRLPAYAAISAWGKKVVPPPMEFHLPDPQAVRGVMGHGPDAAGALVLLDTVVRCGASLGTVEWWAQYAGSVFYFSPDNARSLVMRSWADKKADELRHVGLARALLRPAAAAAYVRAWRELKNLRMETIQAMRELRQEALAQARRMTLARYGTVAEEAAVKAQVGAYEIVMINELAKYIELFTAHVKAEQLAVLAALYTTQQKDDIGFENAAIRLAHPLFFLGCTRFDVYMGAANAVIGRPWGVG